MELIGNVILPEGILWGAKVDCADGPFKRALLDAETSRIPASLLRRCEQVTYCGIRDVMTGITL